MYNEKTGKVGIKVKGKQRWFNKADAFDASAKIPNHYGVKIDGQNFFFPVNKNMENGNINPYWSIEDNKISRTIPPLYFPRVRIDAEMWRLAIVEMEMKPWNWRVKVQTILQDVVLDAHVKACWTKRKRMTLKKTPAYFDREGNVIESPDLDFIQEHWWYQLMDFMLDAQGYGYQLIELGEMVNGKFPDISVVPRQNISPDREIVASVVYNVSGIPFTFSSDKQDRAVNKKQVAKAQAPNGEYYYDWTVWIKTPNEFGAHTSTCGYGLFYWIGIYAILIRNNLQFNADFVEKYMQPIPWLKTNKSSKEERQKTFNELLDMGSSSAFMTDPTDDLTLLTAGTVGTAHKSYGDFEERMEKKISALILGHQDVMHSIPGKAGSMEDNPVNKAMLEVENEQDQWVSAMERECIRPKLKALGFNIPDDATYGYLNEEQANLAKENDNRHNLDFAKVVQTLKAAGLEVDPKFVSEYTGLPVTKSEPTIDVPETVDPEEVTAAKNFYNRVKNSYANHGRK